ncbi:MAG: EAL domain-containing protein [Gammaproteobacteria bacterium]|nr:EAL domain-containing protein [Gammaproteobacteria bacterium]
MLDLTLPGGMAALQQQLEQSSEGGITFPFSTPSADEEGNCAWQVTITRFESGHLHWLFRSDSAVDSITEQALQRDRLTGLPSRQLFLDRAEQAIMSARRNRHNVAILRLGLDNFTRLNEGLGHDYGDEVLQQFAQRVMKVVRNSDTVARLEGDQFGLVMTITSTGDAVLVANKLLQMLEPPFAAQDQEILLSASIGISLFPSDGDEIMELLQQTQIAMRHVKLDGGNTFRFFATEMNLRARQRIELENDIRRGLDENEFVLYYQAKVDSDTRRIVGAEALIRWIHPEKGMISPGLFIPVAEESGLISRIGTWVIQEACRQNRAWSDAGLAIVKISVNVAAPQFRDQQMVAKVGAVLAESGLDASMLELELTESLLVGDIENTIARLQQLRDMGVAIAIDDFGTGYSSLSYLSRFPLTTLKIDRAFIQDVTINRHTAEIARAIIALSHGLELAVVAEGVESSAHINFLKEHGCNVIQGFYYSMPVAAEKFADLLRRGYIDPEPESFSETGKKLK